MLEPGDRLSGEAFFCDRELTDYVSFPVNLYTPIQPMFRTNTGRSMASRDGPAWSATLDGSDIMCVVPTVKVHTPKQLVFDDTLQRVGVLHRRSAKASACIDIMETPTRSWFRTGP